MYRFFLGGLCAVGLSASAAELVEESMIVTATRGDAEAVGLPFSVASIDMDQDMREGWHRSVPESLRYTPGIMVQRTAHGQGSPFIRGFTSQRTLFMIDGVRLNNSVFREGPNQYWATVDPYSIDHLEVVKGPGSVLYGSDAVGGTVQAITKGVSGEGWTRHGNIRYSDAENSVIGRLDVAGYLTDRVAIVLGGTVRDFGDLEGGDEVGTQPKTGYDEAAWDAKLIWTLNEDSSLTIAHFGMSLDDAWRTHKTIYGISWEGTTVGSELSRVLDQDRALTYAQYHHSGLSGIADQMTATVSWHHQEEEQYRTKSDGATDWQGFDVGTLGLQAEFDKDTDSGMWTYGVEYYTDDVDSFKHKLNDDGSIKSSSVQGPVADDASYDTLGVYVQDQIDWTDQLGVILGARYSRAEADADTVQDPVSGDPISLEDDWDDVVGSARLRYFLTGDQTAQAYVGVSQGFRAPNLSDLTRLDGARHRSAYA